MRLYLVRHGEAKPREADPEQPLSQKGRRDVEKTAAFLRPLGLSVETIWHSGKTRARQTAELLSRAVSAKRGLLQRESLSPLDPIEPVAKELDSLDEDLMIVGHMPFLGALASLLAAGDPTAEVAAFPPAAALCLEKNPDASWLIRWLLTPELLAGA